jgi:hypothetical protein
MENIWGIKISKIALPEEKLSLQEWFKTLGVSSLYQNKELIYNATSLNNQYNFSKLKTNKK